MRKKNKIPFIAKVRYWFRRRLFRKNITKILSDCSIKEDLGINREEEKDESTTSKP